MTAGRTVNSLSQDWGTPKKYVDAVAPCSGERSTLIHVPARTSIVRARVEYRIPTHDGLSLPWTYRRIYVNPPYGADRDRGTTINDWLRKCAAANSEHGTKSSR